MSGDRVEAVVLVGTGPASGYVRVVGGGHDVVLLPDEARQFAVAFDQESPEFAETIRAAADEAEARQEATSRPRGVVGRRKKKPRLQNPDSRAVLRRAMRGT